MSDKPTSREIHNLHLDERLRVRRERKIRHRETRRITGALVQPVIHEFETPVPHRYLGSRGVDYVDPPGAIGTDFAGCVI